MESSCNENSWKKGEWVYRKDEVAAALSDELPVLVLSAIGHAITLAGGSCLSCVCVWGDLVGDGLSHEEKGSLAR